MKTPLTLVHPKCWRKRTHHQNDMINLNLYIIGGVNTQWSSSGTAILDISHIRMYIHMYTVYVHMSMQIRGSDKVMSTIMSVYMTYENAYRYLM